MKIKSEKGVNMITLSVAVILLVIITSVLVYNAKDEVKVKSLSNLYNDIEILDGKIASYYIKYGDIPTITDYENSEVINSIEAHDQKNPNDEDEYAVIDLNKLDNANLNFGRDYDEILYDKDIDADNLTDIYIINKASHTIYYPKGIEVKGKVYYTEKQDWSKVELD